MTERSIEEQFSINNFVFKQGTEANYLYIVHSGEFEVMRYSNKGQRLMNPTDEDKSRKALKMDSNEIKKYLKPNGRY